MGQRRFVATLDRILELVWAQRMEACDPAIMHPPHTMPMLEWWRGIYEHVFIAVHPFYGVRRNDGQGREDLLDWNERPKDYENTLKSRGEAVSWETVR